MGINSLTTHDIPVLTKDNGMMITNPIPSLVLIDEPLDDTTVIIHYQPVDLSSLFHTNSIPEFLPLVKPWEYLVGYCVGAA
jgi:hypothetical protein